MELWTAPEARENQVSLVDKQTGIEDFIFYQAVQEILVKEHSHTLQEAKSLIARFPEIMKASMKMKISSFRVAAMALEMKEDEEI